MLGDEEYRIMAIEDQGIKVIRSTDLDTEYVFDDSDNRPVTTNTYCEVVSSRKMGCNTWSKASEINQNGTYSDTITNVSKTGTVIANSTVYTYLHDTYYNNLSSVDKYIVKDATWNVGPVTAIEPLPFSETIKNEESNWTWNGKIGLMTYSEYIGAQSPTSSGYSSCSSNIYGNSNCGEDNWLIPSSSTWTITPGSDVSIFVWFVDNYGAVAVTSANSSVGLRPVVYLSTSIQLEGTGIQNNAFKIVES